LYGDIVLGDKRLETFPPMVMRGYYVHTMQQNQAGIVELARSYNKLTGQKSRFTPGNLR
jgi:hypothetical protein